MRNRLLTILATSAVVAAGLTFLPGTTAEAATEPSAVAASMQAATDYYFSNWLPTLSVSLGWTGKTSGCVAGSISSKAATAILGSVNYLRAVAGLPAYTVDPTLKKNSQAAALMLQATGLPVPGNDPHTRTGSGWKCASAAGRSNDVFENVAMAKLASNATAPISLYMADAGIPTLGHRSNILLASGTTVGIGETSNWNVLQVNPDWNLTPSQDFGWPAAGYTPYEVTSVTTNNNWVFYPASGNVSNATVSVQKNGQPLTGVQKSGGIWNAAQAAQGNAIAWTMPTIAKPARGTADDYTVTISGITGRPETSVTYDVYIFMANQFKLTFDPNGGTVSQTTKQFAVGAALGTLPTPTRAGYTFAGWYTNTSGGKKLTSTTKLTSPGDITVYARWTAKKYKLTFNANGGATPKTSGKVTKTKTVTMGKTLGTLPTSTRTGHSFAGWFTAKSGGTKVSSTTPVSAKNETLYAHWTAKSYKVTLKPQSGTVDPTSIQVTYNSTYKILPTPVRAGYGFQGWYTKATGGTKIANSTKVKIVKAQTLYAHWKKVPSPAITFHDAALKACVNAALKQSSTATVTQAQASGLKSLWCSSKDGGRGGIKSIQDLKYFTNLQTLGLSYQQITDISPLVHNTKLTMIDLSSNNISDISPLAGLTNLTDLYITDANISDLTPLAGLPKLDELILSNNQISDVTPLSSLPMLRNLVIDGNNISAVASLAGLTTLSWLTIDSNPITDIATLSGMPNLTLLSMNNCGLSDLTPLSAFTNLTDLSLERNGITQLAPLSQLANLTSLDLGYNEIVNVAPLASLSNMETLNLVYNKISDVSSLLGLQNLSNINLDRNLLCGAPLDFPGDPWVNWGDQACGG